MTNFFHQGLLFQLDNKSSQQFQRVALIQGIKWKIVTLFVLYYYFVKVFGPKWMNLRPAYNLHPYILIYNGYQFGIHGMGFLLSLWTTNLGTLSWTCEAIDPFAEDIKTWFTIYVVYIFFWAKVMECLETVMYILMKKRRYVHFTEIFRFLANIGLAYIGLKVFPGNLISFYPLCDLFLGALIFGHNTLLAASIDAKPKEWWKTFIFTLRLIEYTILFYHGFYILTIDNCFAPNTLAIYECLFSLFNIVLISRYYFNITR